MKETSNVLSIHQLFTQKGLTLGVAESCTGGALSASITSLSGASDYFVGGLVTYSVEAKQKVLGVLQKTLDLHGVISRQVAAEMALGVIGLLDVDFSVATTGIAGPTGGSDKTPIGTVCLSVTRRGDMPRTKLLHLRGDRHQIIHQAVDESQKFLLLCLQEDL